MWLGQGLALSYELCQSILGLLMEDDFPAWLTGRGVQALTKWREQYEFLREDPTRCLATERGLEFFTYAGGHLNLVMAQALSASLPAEAHANDLSIVIDKCTTASFRRIKACLAPLDRPALLSNIQPTPQWLSQLKFSACLPESIAAQVFIERLDVTPWDEFATIFRPHPDLGNQP
jgi:hypothetical protein